MIRLQDCSPKWECLTAEFFDYTCHFAFAILKWKGDVDIIVRARLVINSYNMNSSDTFSNLCMQEIGNTVLQRFPPLSSRAHVPSYLQHGLSIYL